MLGDKIKKFRVECGLTQKELADKLYVTAQAVSRWENNEVEPSVATLTSMASIFNVSVAELFGEEVKTVETVVEKEYVYKEQKPVLAVCSQCNKPIYKGAEIVRKDFFDGTSTREKILCRSCNEKNEKREREQAISIGVGQRNKSFKLGALFTFLIIIAVAIITSSLSLPTGVVVGASAGSILFFPFLSCLYLKNNFVEDMVLEIASWTVKWPHLIFTLNLDGIIWLLTVKLLFWIIGIIVSVTCLILAIAIGLIVSVFVYPFALSKNIRHPELTDII